MHVSLFLLNGNFIIDSSVSTSFHESILHKYDSTISGPCCHLIFLGKSMKIYQMKWKKWTLFATTYADSSRQKEQTILWIYPMSTSASFTLDSFNCAKMFITNTPVVFSEKWRLVKWNIMQLRKLSSFLLKISAHQSQGFSAWKDQRSVFFPRLV